MEAGLVWQCDRFEIGATMAATYSVSGNSSEYAETYGFHVTAQSDYMEWGGLGPTPTPGFVLSCESIFDAIVLPRHRWTASVLGVTLTNPLFPGWEDGWNGSMGATLGIDDLKLYATANNTWKLTWSAIDFSDLGSGSYSGGASSWESNPLVGLTPAAIPLLGIPVKVEAGAATAVEKAVPFPTGSGYANCSGSATGGWRYKIGSTWYALPVTLPSYSVPSPIDPGFVANTGQVTATSTWGAAITAASSATGGLTQTQSVQRGSVRLVPDLPKSLRRMNGDYLALVLRGAMPTMVCRCDRAAIDPSSTPPNIHTSSTQLHPASGTATNMLCEVSNGANVIETPMAEHTYAPFYLFSSREDDDTGGYDSIEVTYPFSVTHQANEIAMLRGGTDLATSGSNDAAEVNFWANPHWSYGLWFPEDQPPPGHEHWDIDGSAVDPWGYVDDLGFHQGYWLWIGDQVMHNAGLPGGGSQVRTSIVSEPLVYGYWGTPGSALMEAVFGEKTSWWGIARFDAFADYGASSVTIGVGTASRWSSPDSSCTIALGASTATLTPTSGSGAGTITVDVELGTYLEAPYQTPTLAEKIEIGWPGTNIDAVRAYLVGIDGSTVLLADNATGSFYWPTSGLAATKYAGDWVQDYSTGCADVTDQGADENASGISAATFADTNRATAYRLLPGRTAKSLRFEIDVANRASTVAVTFPVFHKAVRQASAFALNGSQSAFVWPQGPGARFGSASYWDYLLDTFQDPPGPLAPGNRPTALDWLCHKAHWHDGVDTSAVATALGALYDATETGGGDAKQAAAYYTTAFLANPSTYSNPIAVLVNTLRAVPPLCAFPERARDSDLQPAGGWAQESWSYCQKGRYGIVPGSSPPILWETDRTANWLSAESAPLGWQVSSHSHTTDGTEDGFHFSMGASDFGKQIRPWHGIFAVCLPGPESGGVHLARDARLGMLYATIEQSGGGIRIRRFNIVPSPAMYRALLTMGGDSDEFEVSADGTNAQVCVPSNSSVLVLYEESGTIFERRSWSHGETWGAAVSVAAGSNPSVAAGNNEEWEFAAYHDGANWVCARRQKEGEAWESAGTICALPAGKAGLVESPDACSTLVFMAADGTDVRRWISTNLGDAWTEA